MTVRRRNNARGFERIWQRLGLYRLAPKLSLSEVFPGIEDELGPFQHYLRGNVLNAGAGNRDIRAMVCGTLFNQDIPTGLHNADIDIYSPLDKIPKESAFFDAIVCNGVLEHVEQPDAVLREFERVCKPGGILYLCVPFMQPEHLDPTDFQRYTLDGLRRHIERHGFEVIHARGLHSVYTTLAWISIEWLNSQNTLEHFLLKCLIFPFLRRKCRRSQLYVHSLASAYRIVGRRKGGEENKDLSGGSA